MSDTKNIDKATGMVEIWKPAPNDIYVEASNLGRLRFVDTKEIIEPQKWAKAKYPSYFSRDGKKFRFMHRTVAFTWCQNNDPDHCTVVDHIDGNVENMRPDNLRWCTPRMNQLYAVARRKASGAKRSPKRFNLDIAKQIRKDHLFGKSIAKLAEEYNVHTGNMSAIVNNLIYKDPNWNETKAQYIKERLEKDINMDIVTDMNTACLNWGVKGLCFKVCFVTEQAVKNLAKIIKDWDIRAKFDYAQVDNGIYECVIY